MGFYEFKNVDINILNLKAHYIVLVIIAFSLKIETIE